jgi:hypothetical protein
MSRKALKTLLIAAELRYKTVYTRQPAISVGGIEMAQSSTKFQPGQSGNPGGRPAVVKTIQALAREHTEEAIQALREALKHPSTRVAAATALLDRGYGRPMQTQQLRVIRSFSDLTDEELRMLEASILAEAD